ncbi:terpene synthase family protein [Tolypothrix sp. PCC 7910]|uniref:terpene synthase family protein n=1 Tax=Tolypothrix sp. PCC 7910 TaxID=2099387 RepID=UPI0014277AA5|nr:terpene synthase family protein [Tolypothrix sp. PCC 7910]QIR39777.1 terpene synthase family protein [Tolypothrix sp. PCC 7910]
MEKFVLPNLYCPFPTRINPHVEVLADYSMEWVLRYKLMDRESLYQKFSKAKFYLLTAGAYPDCPLEELKIANDVISWLFIWDDQCDVSDLGKKPELVKSLCNRFIEILNGAELTPDDLPLGFALRNIRQRIINRGNITFFHHFIHNFEDYFHGCIEESNNRTKLIVPDLQKYIEIRSFNAAAALCLNLIEFCNRVNIPYYLRKHEIFKSLSQITIKILGWSNDIFSVQREMANGEVHNLVIVLCYQQQKSIAQSIKTAAKMHDLEVNKLIELENSMPFLGEEVHTIITKYISGLHSWIRGNLDWYTHTGRYEIFEKIETNSKTFEILSS